MTFFSLLRFPGQVVGTVIDTVLTARAVVRHGERFAAWAEPAEGLVEFEAEHEVLPGGFSWGDVAGTYREALSHYCNRCGGSYTGEHTCLRDLSPTPEGDERGPVGDDANPPLAPPAGLNPPEERVTPDDVSGEGPSDSAIPPAPEGHPTSEVRRLRQQQVAFAARLGFGDNIEEPAATLDEMVYPIEQAFAEARDHQECPRTCERCGERLATTLCPDCNGSGANNEMSANYGAYVECEQCAGSGWLHDGCAEKTYADLATELQHVRDGAQTLGRVIHSMQRAVLDITGLHHLIDESGDGPWDVVWEALAEGYQKSSK